MKQVWITKTGTPEVLQLREAPDPKLGPSEVCIQVQAIGVNFADIMARKGLYPDAPPLPAVVGYEVAGVVKEAGTLVTSLKPGDEVLAMTRFGGYSTRVCVSEKQVFKRPPGMTAEVGAALLVTYLTAFQAIVVMGGVRHPDELGGMRQRILVHGAAGGVGTAAADLAKIYQAELLGTASPSKHAFLKEHGYDHAIDYRTGDWVQQVHEITGGRGVHLVLDPIGGHFWKESMRCLSPTGRVVLFGFSAASGPGGKARALQEILRVPWTWFSPFHLINRNRGVLGLNLGRMWGEADAVRAWGEKLLDYYQEEKIHPLVDRTFPLEKAAEAHQYIEDRKNKGKVLLTVNSE